MAACHSDKKLSVASLSTILINRVKGQILPTESLASCKTVIGRGGSEERGRTEAETRASTWKQQQTRENIGTRELYKYKTQGASL